MTSKELDCARGRERIMPHAPVQYTGETHPRDVPAQHTPEIHARERAGAAGSCAYTRSFPFFYREITDNL